MFKLFRDLWLVILLIAGASAILLLSDLDQRKNEKSSQDYPYLAFFQFSSTPLLDNHQSGMIDRLKREGLIAPDEHNIRRFNPQGDISTANTIAREICNSPFDAAFTSSTVALQVLNNANLNTKKLHIFGAVTDPYGAGVGISGPEPHQHPPYLVGIGTFQPVKRAFEVIKAMNPSIRKIGVVWNPGEQCSEACFYEAKEICDKLGIQLIEAVATNTSEVAEAARSLIAKGVEAIWIGGDTVAIASASLIINLAKQVKIPVFTNDPTDADRGALFGIGADYYTVGVLTAEMGIEVLKGKNPQEIAITNQVPEVLLVNADVLKDLSARFALTPELEAQIAANPVRLSAEGDVIDFLKEPNPSPERLAKASTFLNLNAKYGRVMKIAVLTLVENKTLDQAIMGLKSGLKSNGLAAGSDIDFKLYSAQGEISQLPALIDAAIQDQSDLLITVTTPALIAAAKKVRDIPVVFTVASEPARLKLFLSGAPENFCGVYDDPSVAELLDMAISHRPNLKKVGILHDPAQMNSMISVEKLLAAAKDRKIEVLQAGVSQISELKLAAESLIQRGAEVFILSADNMVTTGFTGIVQVTKNANIPIYCTELNLIPQGAFASIGDNFFDWGVQSADLASKVLAGVPPNQLGFSVTAHKKRIDPLNPETSTPLKISIVQYSETEFAERCHEGLIAGMTQSGLTEGTDYRLKSYNAQGDMSTLSSIMTTVKSDKVDLLLVISTPALQAALRQAGPDTKIVFTGVGDAVKAGAGTSETDHLPNVTGITTRSSFDGMARLIKKLKPETKKVGTLFTPAEINSELYKNWFEEALKAEGIALVAVPVTSSADLAQAADEMCRQNIQVVAQIVDNLTRPGFALIARKAADYKMPVFVFDSDQMKDGGTICLARDYYDAGLEAAEKAVMVIRGKNPKFIPFNNTQSEKWMYNPELVHKFNLNLTKDFLEKASLYSPK